MEVDSPPHGFDIENSKIPIHLSLQRVEDLKPHEQTVAGTLGQLVNVLRQEPVLRHPLVVDAKSGLVLDGTHRLAAITQMNCGLAPCALVDYADSRIGVERWFRKIEGSSLATFQEKVATMRPRLENPSKAQVCLSKRTCYASLEDLKSCLVFPASASDPVSLAQAAFEIETVARNNNLGISYTDTIETPASKGFVLSTISITKSEILEASLRHRLFPPKTTRHIIPSRPLGTAVKLAWLRETAPERAQDKFLKHLQSMRLTRRPEGSWVGSRRYQEEVFVFE